MATSETSQLLPRKSKLKRHRNSDSSKTPPVDKDSDERPAKRQRLLIVANRLPLSAERNGQDPWSLKATVGGLANALFDVELEGYEATWIGWPGVSVEDEAGKQALTTALAEKKCIPVFLTKEIVRDYYNGFCNKILWPLFHYFGLPREGHTTRSFQLQFEAYNEANKLFADVVNQHYEEGDLVWCHDYHLMFVPQKLKENNPQMKIGWFLHTPFPSYEIHQNLPSRSELLRAVLAADLVGFHTYDYARHFINACTRILGLKGIPDGVVDQERLTRVAAFPIGINSQRFTSALKNPEAQDNIKKLRELLSGKKVIFGVDHLDMTKGIPQKYLAFEKFLEENEDWREKVVLVQIAIPPRTDVATYEKLASQVHEMVGRINGRFGTCTETPICHLDRSLDFDALCEHYSISDVALVTSLRDGMNLVSYEFVACQDSMNGVLILSEFAGAAQSLGAGAILVNPWNLTEVAAAIGRALTMPVEERETRHRQNFEHVTKHTAQKWAEFFLSELKIAVIKAQQRIRMVPPRQLVVRDAVRRYVECEHGLLILGFNAALTEARGKNQKEKSELPKEGDSPKLDTKLKLHPDLKEPLNMLCQDPNTTIVVLSGSDKNLLEETFGEYAMWVVAENGMFVRSPEGIQTPTERQGMASVTNIKRVLEYFTERTPGSYIVERETSLLWNYKDADVEIGRLQARVMLQQLCTGVIVNGYVAVVQGSHSIEVRPLGVTKGVALVHTLKMMIDSQAIPSYEAIDYVLCLGHFTEEDEDIYDIFNPDREPDEDSSSSSSSVPPTTNLLTLTNENYFPCAVGRALTSARYGLNSSDDVVALLKEMAEAKASQSSG